MQLKDVVVDKAIKVAKKTAPAFKSSLKDIARTTSDILVNYGDDLYDELDDVSTGGAKSLISNGVMGGRNAFRGTKSTNNILRKHKLKKDKIYSNRKSLEDLQELPEDLFNKSPEELDGWIKQNDKLLSKEAKMQWKSMSKSEKTAFFKKNKISKGLQLKKSANMTFKNQTRKGINSLSNKKDISSKTIGKVSKGAWSAVRYRRQFMHLTHTVRHVVSFVSHAISSLVSIIVSIPVIISTILTSIPIMVILAAVIMILSIFTNMDFTGRLTEFVNNEVYLEYRYDANVAPDEILSITTALGWSTQKVEDYEALFAILMDGKDENWNISYETMQDNIFNKYNPANYSFDNRISVKRTGFLGNTSSLLTYEDYLNLFPNYKNLSPEKKALYGNEESVAELKDRAVSSLNENAINYASQYVMTSGVESFFTAHPLSIADIRNHAATYKVGYRAFNEGAFHGGTDIAAETGTNAFAVADAKVIYAQSNITADGETCLSTDSSIANDTTCGKFKGGNQVILKQDVFDAKTGEASFLYTAYYHLQTGSVSVSSGDTVEAGEHIGNVGNTGMSMGAHLHLQSWLSSEDEYRLPYSRSNSDINAWSKCIDSTMLLDNDFRNHIFGR